MSKVLRNSLFGVVGILVVWQLYFVFASVFGKILFLVLPKSIVLKVGLGISILVIIAGFVIGVMAADKKRLFYKIFLPNNQNLLATLLLSALLHVYSLFAKAGFNIHTFSLIQIAVGAVLFYPFAALALYAYNNWDSKPIKQYKTLTVLVLIILSPVALVVGSGMHSKFNNPTKWGHGKYYSDIFVHSKISEGCGAYVYGFPDDSPAEEAGMQVGETITEINGQEIKSLNDIKEITYPLTEETEVIVITNNGTYEVTTYYDEVKGKQRIGTNVWQACGSKFSKSGNFNKIHGKLDSKHRYLRK